MQNDRFEWHDAKAASNLTKHRISFEDACIAFDDPDGVDNLDVRDDYGEERINRIALVGTLVMTVTFVQRENRIRIISARKAKKDEQDE